MQDNKDNHFQCQIVRPRTAIIIVDVQNDFISGSLAISTCPAKQNGEEVIFTFETLFIKLGYGVDYLCGVVRLGFQSRVVLLHLCC